MEYAPSSPPKNDHVGLWILLGLAGAGATLFAPAIGAMFNKAKDAATNALDPSSPLNLNSPARQRQAAAAARQQAQQQAQQARQKAQQQAAALSAKRTKLQQRISDLQSKLAAAKAKVPPNATQIATLTAALAAAQQQIAALG